MLTNRTVGGYFRHPIFRLHSPVDALFQEWTDARRAPARTGFADHADHYAVQFRVPGIVREALSLQVEDGELVLRAERAAEAPEGFTPVRRERRRFQLSRRIPVPADADAEKVEATLSDGILKITVGKRAEHQPRTIAIQ